MEDAKKVAIVFVQLMRSISSGEMDRILNKRKIILDQSHHAGMTERIILICLAKIAMRINLNHTQVRMDPGVGSNRTQRQYVLQSVSRRTALARRAGGRTRRSYRRPLDRRAP